MKTPVRAVVMAAVVTLAACGGGLSAEDRELLESARATAVVSSTTVAPTTTVGPSDFCIESARALLKSNRTYFNAVRGLTLGTDLESLTAERDEYLVDVTVDCGAQHADIHLAAYAEALTGYTTDDDELVALLADSDLLNFCKGIDEVVNRTADAVAGFTVFELTRAVCEQRS